MRKILRAVAVLAGLCLLVAIWTIPIGVSGAQAEKKIRVIYTNDLTGNVDPCG